jgi:hypothetical protein
MISIKTNKYILSKKISVAKYYLNKYLPDIYDALINIIIEYHGVMTFKIENDDIPVTYKNNDNVTIVPDISNNVSCCPIIYYNVSIVPDISNNVSRGPMNNNSCNNRSYDQMNYYDINNNSCNNRSYDQMNYYDINNNTCNNRSVRYKKRKEKQRRGNCRTYSYINESSLFTWYP